MKGGVDMKVQAGTIVRTVVLLFALFNQLLTAAGKNPLPFSEDEVYQAGTAVVTAITAIAAWWKNNSFSQEALTADEYMKALKQEEKQEG